MSGAFLAIFRTVFTRKDFYKILSVFIVLFVFCVLSVFT